MYLRVYVRVFGMSSVKTKIQIETSSKKFISFEKVMPYLCTINLIKNIALKDMKNTEYSNLRVENMIVIKDTYINLDNISVK